MISFETPSHIHYEGGSVSKDELRDWAWNNTEFSQSPSWSWFMMWCDENWDEVLQQFLKNK